MSEQEKVVGTPVTFDELSEGDGSRDQQAPRNIDILRDVALEVSVELGRVNMSIDEILRLSRGSVIELDKMAGEPVDILVNGHRIARGEVVVIDEHFGIRITSLMSARDRLDRIS